LAEQRPDDVAATVLFYGTKRGDFLRARSAFLGHFAETDPYESLPSVRQLERRLVAGREVTFHVYPKTGHWFFEADRPDAYNAAAAQLAWERTVTFLKCKLEQSGQSPST
jgi:carboxymethylenebutenolidase